MNPFLLSQLILWCCGETARRCVICFNGRAISPLGWCRVTRQANLTLQDRFGYPVRPREWFLVLINATDEGARSTS